MRMSRACQDRFRPSDSNQAVSPVIINARRVTPIMQIEKTVSKRLFPMIHWMPLRAVMAYS